MRFSYVPHPEEDRRSVSKDDPICQLKRFPEKHPVKPVLAATPCLGETSTAIPSDVLCHMDVGVERVGAAPFFTQILLYMGQQF